ncbi:MAG: nucleotide exchange factor GrpE [Prochlorothrix sp.]|nr:nucleotide exchange factor GrpE [Prochlorothrix sp.]
MPPSARDLAAQKVQFKKEQEQLFRDFLDVVDALDQACQHWQQAHGEHLQSFQAVDVHPRSRRSGWQRWLRGIWAALRGQPIRASEANTTALKAQMAEILESAHTGTAVIHRSLLDALDRQEVKPIFALGQPFNPNTMKALGREERSDAAPNVVIEEVVRGYQWRDRVLREAQVIVAVPPAAD